MTEDKDQQINFSSARETLYFLKNQFAMEGSTSRHRLLETFNSQKKGIFILKQRYLRKVIQIHRELGVLNFNVPHNEVYTLPKKDFLDIARYDLPDIYYYIKDQDSLPQVITLLSEPTPKELSSFQLDYFRYQYWGLLFHAEIHKSQMDWKGDEKIESQTGEFLHFLGQRSIEEIREVLSSANVLFDSENLGELAWEFMAYYLQFYNFAPFCLKRFFPFLEDYEEIHSQILDFGFPEKELLEKSRPSQSFSVENLLEYRREYWRDSMAFEEEKFDLDYYLHRVYFSTKLEKWHLPREKFQERYEDFLKDLFKEVIQNGRIVGKLSFRRLVEQSLSHRVKLDRQQLILLDEVFAQALPELYKSSTPLDRFFIEKLPVEFTENQEYLQKRKEMTSGAIEKFSRADSRLEKRRDSPPSWISRFFYYLTLPVMVLFKLVLFYPLYHFMRQAPAWGLKSNIGQKLEDWADLREFIYYLKNGYDEENKGNRAGAILAFKEAYYHLSHVTRRFHLEEGKELEKKLKSRIEENLDKIEEGFCQVHEITGEYREKLTELLEFLVEPRDMPNNYRRLLQDIQKSYIDSNKEYYRLRLSAWAFSLGKKKARVALTFLPLMKKLRALKSLQRRIYHLRARKVDREGFQTIANEAFTRTEEELRDKLGNEIKEALLKAQIRPQPVEIPKEAKSQFTGGTETAALRGIQQERIAFNKMREEILDLLVEKNFTQYSDLRDVVSRNDLTLHDLKGPKEFFKGDQLLRLDREMSERLRGIHRPGEVYMGVIHRVSSFLFGWKGGRLFSKYALIPFGGSFVAFEGLKHILAPLGAGHALTAPIHHLFSSLYRAYDLSPKWTYFFDVLTWILASGFLVIFFCFTNWGKWLGIRLAKGIWRLIKFVFWTLPKSIWEFPFVQAIYKWRLWQFLHTFLIKPALYSLPIVAPLVYFEILTLNYPWLKGLLVLLIANGIINTPLGRGIFDYFEDRLAEVFHQLNKTVFIGLFHLIMEAFKTGLVWMEYVLYLVDDFFRFRKGEKKISQILKWFFGKIWSGVTYFFRFTIKLIVEPQVNPIKHFPVVTVSHKIILPVAVILYESSRLYMNEAFGQGTWMAWAGAGIVFLFLQFGVPGICGFMAWEFKENWKLYRHAAPKTIQPIYFGSHGEDMQRILRPGFHSGTLPKLYRKVRKATLHAYHYGDFKPLHKLAWQMHHIEEELEKFAHRVLESEFTDNLRIRQKINHCQIGHPRLSPYEVIFPITLKSEEGHRKFEIHFQLRSQALLGKAIIVDEEGEFSPKEKNYLNYALMVFWKKASLQVLTTPLENYLHRECKLDENHRFAYEIDRHQLQIFIMHKESLNEVGVISFDLGEEEAVPVMKGEFRKELPPKLPPLKRSKFYFQIREIKWDDYNDFMSDYTYHGQIIPAEEIIYTFPSDEKKEDSQGES